MKLTTQQTNFMETFGYLYFPGLLKDCIDDIIEAFDQVWEGHGGGHNGKPHDGKSRSCLVPFAGQSAYLSSLLDDPRVDGIMSSLLGEDYIYLGSDGNYYVGDSGWHSDGWPHPIVYYKMAFYLDPLTRETGALRVIPGSHHDDDCYSKDMQAAIRKSEERWGFKGNELPAAVIETEPGDVVVFSEGIKHSSFGGGARRRMFCFSFTPRHTDEEIPLMRKGIANFARFWTDSVYGPEMVRTASPERMVHLEQALANQDHLPELTQEHRGSHEEPSRG